jgi:putative membrane protein
MLWIKSLHVIFMVTWFAGLFYLPRLFVYHTEASEPAVRETLKVMERRLYVIMTIGMVGTWIFGLWLMMLVPAWMQMGWLHAKITLVVLLSGYHGWLKLNLRRFAADTNARSSRFWRLTNEIPALFLVLVVILVIVKPF